jgi:hypothetical protein
LWAANAFARDSSFGSWDLDELAPHDLQRPINQAEWAAMLVEALDLNHALPDDHDVDDLFSLLCARRAEPRWASTERLAGAPAEIAIHEPHSAENGGLRWIAEVPASAFYVLAVRGSGAAEWSIDRRRVGRLDPTRLGQDVSHRVVALPRGFHEIEAAAFHGRLDTVELRPHRGLCIAPAEGWRAGSPLTYGAKARSMVRAFGLEDQLPAEADALLIEGEAFAPESEGAAITDRELEDRASGARWARAGSGPASFGYRVVLERPALVSVVARVHGAESQLWSLDDRYIASVEPPPEALAFGWMKVFTLPLASGEHNLRARVANGSGIDLIRVTPRRTLDRDYLALLEQMGFREGAAGETVTLERAQENLAHPAFRTLTQDLLDRSQPGPDRAIQFLQEDTERFFGRPLSPLVPSEL